jgi:hypothetical protein
MFAANALIDYQLCVDIVFVSAKIEINSLLKITHSAFNIF